MAPRCVLVVAEDPAMVRMLGDGLGTAGWETSASAGVAEAVALATERSFAAVVSEVYLWDADGFALLRELRELGRFVPVVLMAAFAGPHLQRTASEAGAYALLSKPFELEELIAVLDRIEKVGDALEAPPRRGSEP